MMRVGDVLENIAEESASPDEILIRSDSALDLEKMLQELPANYRLILLMRYKDGFSLQEIAEILNLSYNTVKSQHTRALAALRKSL